MDNKKYTNEELLLEAYNEVNDAMSAWVKKPSPVTEQRVLAARRNIDFYQARSAQTNIIPDETMKRIDDDITLAMIDDTPTRRR